MSDKPYQRTTRKQQRLAERAGWTIRHPGSGHTLAYNTACALTSEANRMRERQEVQDLLRANHNHIKE